MSFDDDPLVRIAVAERLEPERLCLLAADDDLRVRYVVAERAPPSILAALQEDPDPEVRRLVCTRMQEHTHTNNDAGDAPAN
jgi:hypothetical protein